ncbi:MAG: hypothetical protein ACXU8A_07525 [Burkholderiaceae bacterium]
MGTIETQDRNSTNVEPATFRLIEVEPEKVFMHIVTPATYRLVEVESPEAFRNAITPKLLDKLKLSPIPVRFVPAATLAGFAGCCSLDFAEFREIVIGDHLVQEHTTVPSSINIRAIYLHEVAHRLTNERHTATFFTINLILCLRAGGEQWQRMMQYDLQDEEDIAAAMTFSWSLARELADTALSMVQCVEIVNARYNKWIDYRNNAPARQQALQKHQNKKDEKIEYLKFQRFTWSAFAFLFGMVATAIIYFQFSHTH